MPRLKGQGVWIASHIKAAPRRAMFFMKLILSDDVLRQKLIQKGATPAHISLVTLLAAKPGIEKIKKEFPQVHIHTAAIDPELNLQKFIVPGLGDFGDRYFGT